MTVHPKIKNEIRQIHQLISTTNEERVLLNAAILIVYDIKEFPSWMKTMLDANLLHGDCMTITGRTLEENLSEVQSPNMDSNDIIFPEWRLWWIETLISHLFCDQGSISYSWQYKWI